MRDISFSMPAMKERKDVSVTTLFSPSVRTVDGLFTAVQLVKDCAAARLPLTLPSTDSSEDSASCISDLLGERIDPGSMPYPLPSGAQVVTSHDLLNQIHADGISEERIPGGPETPDQYFSVYRVFFISANSSSVKLGLLVMSLSIVALPMCHAGELPRGQGSFFSGGEASHPRLLLQAFYGKERRSHHDADGMLIGIVVVELDYLHLPEKVSRYKRGLRDGRQLVGKLVKEGPRQPVVQGQVLKNSVDLFLSGHRCSPEI